VYKDGIAQKNASVEVDHAPVALSVLLEGGGRYQQLNKMLSAEIPSVAHPLTDALVPADQVAVYSYASTVRVLAGFDQPRDALGTVFTHFTIPGFAEANLNDALVDVLKRAPPTRAPSRKAVLLISTGLDTFSHATPGDAVAEAQRVATPVYAIGLAGLIQHSLIDAVGPLAKINWSAANQRLKTLATASGGRTYLRDTALDAPAIYDDMMEHLRVRYVIKYTSSAPPNTDAARTVRIALVDPAGAPLRITDASGKVITARVNLQGTYRPSP
jgi:hypothetical protein